MDPLRIGQVIGVEGDTVEAQITVANLVVEYHGSQYRVGRLGTYVTIPVNNCTLIGYVTRVGATGDLEPGPNPEGPTRLTLSAQLLGTIKKDKFTRGVNEYPTVGDCVRLGVDEDFELIFGSFESVASANGERKSFTMGRFAVDTDFEVKVLGKEFFAKHVAVMGNSGSGKSCTTAKIVSEALRLPHAQVVMFDMHGEYLAAFADDQMIPDVNVTYLSDKNLVLPYWMLQFEEFEQLFVDPSSPENINAQKIFLRQAFQKLKYEAALALGLENEYSVETPLYYSIEQLKLFAENLNECRFVLNSDQYAFARLPHRQLPLEEQEKLLLTRRMEFNRGNAEGETPHATYFGRLLGFINLLESRLNDHRYDFILQPFSQVARNAELAPYFNRELNPGQLCNSIAAVLRQLIGQLGDTRKNLTIVDLSGLPFDVVDVTVAVLTRALFDYNFWTPSHNRHPSLIVYEEAHNYLPRVPLKGRKTFARDAVEKVAKEGRKYGVSAMVVSQRPSELSETLLSQCNSMVLMRMNNPDDQDYAARVVSDQFRSLISLLPSLKPGEGFIIGDSVLMPMRTLIDLPPKMPRSNDVDFFGLWSKGAKSIAVESVIERWWRQERAATMIDPDAAEKRNGTTGQGPTASDTSRGQQPPAPDPPGGAPRFHSLENTPIQPPLQPALPGDNLDTQFVVSEAAPPTKRTPVLSAAQQKLADLARMLSSAKDDG
ncbi:MAG: ATP-binding protein [Phycisphaerae bacterium]